MIKASTNLADLYEADETAWLDAMVELIRQGAYGELDYAHLEEYLSDMAARDRREIKSRLIVLIAHVLKWVYQPERRTISWRRTILVQGQELSDALGSGILREHATAVLADAYQKAVKRAMIETNLPLERFPTQCPYTVDQLLSFNSTNLES